ncbi:uncharacterized protein [Panulirus ornatus]|uniref:uncharacterized protein isoform X1 n=1 Tax=Panulirus ornatus TaxID=150431 RepID=UPI003A87E0A5
MGGTCSRPSHVPDDNWVLAAPATQHSLQPSLATLTPPEPRLAGPPTLHYCPRVAPCDLTQVSVARDQPPDVWAAPRDRDYGHVGHNHVARDTQSAPGFQLKAVAGVASAALNAVTPLEHMYRGEETCHLPGNRGALETLPSIGLTSPGHPPVLQSDEGSYYCDSRRAEVVVSLAAATSVACVLTPTRTRDCTATMPTTRLPVHVSHDLKPTTSLLSPRKHVNAGDNCLSEEIQMDDIMKADLWDKHSNGRRDGPGTCVGTSVRRSSNIAIRAKDKCDRSVVECRRVSSAPVTAITLAAGDGVCRKAVETNMVETSQDGLQALLEKPIQCGHLEAFLARSHNRRVSPSLLLTRSFWWDQYITYFLRTIQDPASQRLTWYKPPLSVLVIKKVRDAQVIQPFIQLVKWLTIEKRMVVFVEASVLEESLVTSHSGFPVLKDKLMSFREGQDDLTDKIDFIICLGGDGTLLYASSLFQQSVPPVMAFHLGSLGFLTPFKFDNFQDQVTNVLEGHAALTLRSRLRCIILRKDQDTGKTGRPPTNLLVLNEVVIDRGPSPYLSNIDLYLDGKRITSVQGDGLIVSTPTGSTAYAVAAGASMIHPSVPAIMLTPICPHSLSFRPIVVPAGVELKIAVSRDSRNTAWVSFDGRKRQELFHGDSLRVTTSIYPVPSICAEDQIADWFASLDECLRWNDRKRQKHFDDPEDSSPADLTPDLTHSSSSDTLDSLSERNESCDN